MINIILKKYCQFLSLVTISISCDESTNRYLVDILPVMNERRKERVGRVWCGVRQQQQQKKEDQMYSIVAAAEVEELIVVVVMVVGRGGKGVVTVVGREAEGVIAPLAL